MTAGLADLLRSGERRVGVWGLGYIGYSTVAHFAREGVHCLGLDIAPEKVAGVLAGRVEAMPNVEYWFGFDTRPLVRAGLIDATMDSAALFAPDVAVHVIAVPTELDGRPHHAIMESVLGMIFAAGHGRVAPEPPLVIIESTLSPNVFATVVPRAAQAAGVTLGRDVLIGAAPRRDWFVSPDKTLKTLPRVVGGTDPATTGAIAGVLGIVSEHVLRARDATHACAVKSVENAYRHVGITLANQLALAYPDLDMIEVLELAGTKWNVETYQPSFGIGGYCIPLAPEYVLEGAARPQELTLLAASVAANGAQPQVVADSLARRGARSAGVLGLAYTGDIRVHVLSPTFAVARELAQRGVTVKVNDPLYTPQEVRELCGLEWFAFPDGMAEFDTVLVSSPHMPYRALSGTQVLKSLPNCRQVLDNPGIWRSVPFSEHGISYHRPGDPQWIE